MGILEDIADVAVAVAIGDVAVAIGGGVYSVGEDVVLGVQRSAQGFGTSGLGRITQIGFENEALTDLLADLVRFGVSERSPLAKIICTVLEQYYGHIPEHILRKIYKKAGLGALYVGGRLVLGRYIANFIAIKIARKIATTVAYKQFAKKLTVSAGAASTGIGIPISMLMFQGVAQRASNGRVRLMKKYPALYLKLHRQRRLDLVFFLVEKPLEKHLNIIEYAARNRTAFERELKKLEEKLGD